MILAPHQDAFGRMLLDALRGEAGFEVVERDDGRVDVERAGEHYLKLPRRPDPGTRELLDAARGRVLDIGCGAGRYGLALQRRGHEVVGIDTSPGALEAARSQGLEHTQALAVTAVSSKQLGHFDTLLLGGNNFGLLESPKRARWLLARFAAITPSDGRIVATSRDVTQTHDADHRRYMAANTARGRLPGQLRLRVRWKQFKTPWFEYLMVSQTQMHEILEATPWHVTRIIPTGGPTYAAVLEKR